MTKEAKDFNERLEALKGMNLMVRNMNHEDAYYSAWIWLVPDEADEDDLIDIAEDIEYFNRVVQQFLYIMRVYAKDGILFGDYCIDEKNAEKYLNK